MSNNDMYKTCKYCKHYNNGVCSKITMMQSDSIRRAVYEVFESGELSDYLTENIDSDDLIEVITSELKEQGLIKKNKKIDNSTFDIECYVIEALDHGISNFLLSQIKNITKEQGVEVYPDFCCKYFL